MASTSSVLRSVLIFLCGLVIITLFLLTSSLSPNSRPVNITLTEITEITGKYA